MTSFHQGEFPNFAGNFTDLSDFYRNIFHITKPLARKSIKAIFSIASLECVNHKIKSAGRNIE